jgi:hypothetical protein
LRAGERGFHDPQALIERKPGRTGMPGQQLLLLLLDCGTEAEIESGVPAHLSCEHPRAAFGSRLSVIEISIN